jgi:hypothetical protein
MLSFSFKKKYIKYVFTQMSRYSFIIDMLLFLYVMKRCFLVYFLKRLLKKVTADSNNSCQFSFFKLKSN